MLHVSTNKTHSKTRGKKICKASGSKKKKKANSFNGEPRIRKKVMKLAQAHVKQAHSSKYKTEEERTCSVFETKTLKNQCATKGAYTFRLCRFHLKGLTNLIKAGA